MLLPGCSVPSTIQDHWDSDAILADSIFAHANSPAFGANVLQQLLKFRREEAHKLRRRETFLFDNA